MRNTREEIIQAVKAAARAEGIDILGRSRFEAITEIREAEWKYYWARRGDVVREAGLSPGAFTARKEDGEVLASLIPLIQKFGRWPTTGDMRIYARENPGSVNEQTVRKRGDRRTLARKLVEYCSSHDGFEDVAKICAELSAESSPDSELIKSNDPIQGYVYLMTSGRFYKLGKSKSPDRRRSEVALLLPHDTETIHVIPTDDPDGIEAYWHNRFKDKHHRGEFFRLDRLDVQAFKRRKDYM